MSHSEYLLTVLYKLEDFLLLKKLRLEFSSKSNFRFNSNVTKPCIIGMNFKEEMTYSSANSFSEYMKAFPGQHINSMIIF